MKKNRRGTSNAAMKGYLKLRAMTNASIINDIDFATEVLIKHYQVPYERAHNIANSFQSARAKRGI